MDAEAGSFHECPSSPDCHACRGGNRFDWSFVDAAYCISLRDRDDRAGQAAAEFHRVGLCHRVRFYRPERQPKNPARSIWESHRAVVQHALLAGHDTVLIVEDDVIFRPALTPRRLASVRTTFRLLPFGWRIFYLGHWPIQVRFVRCNLVQTRSGCAHAYIASHELMEWLASRPYPFAACSSIVGKGIDAAYAQMPGAYAHFPMLAIQSASPSDHKLRSRQRGIRKLSHIVTRTRLHEYLLCHLMRPAELLVAALSLLQPW